MGCFQSKSKLKKLIFYLETIVIHNKESVPPLEEIPNINKQDNLSSIVQVKQHNQKGLKTPNEINQTAAHDIPKKTPLTKLDDYQLNESEYDIINDLFHSHFYFKELDDNIM